MDIENQKEVWNAIADDWATWKTTSDPQVREFVENANGNLLDVGCASGRNFAKTNAKIYGIDFSDKMIKLAEKHAKELGIKSDCSVHDLLECLEFKDDFFDEVICIAVLHCIPGEDKRKQVLREIYRVMNPGAKVLIKVWNKKNKKFIKKPKEKLIAWRDKGKRYYYFYDSSELRLELEDVGFKIVSLNSEEDGFQKQEIVVLCEKLQ